MNDILAAPQTPMAIPGVMNYKPWTGERPEPVTIIGFIGIREPPRASYAQQNAELRVLVICRTGELTHLPLWAVTATAFLPTGQAGLPE